MTSSSSSHRNHELIVEILRYSVVRAGAGSWISSCRRYSSRCVRRSPRNVQLMGGTEREPAVEVAAIAPSGLDRAKSGDERARLLGDSAATAEAVDDAEP